MMVARKSRTSPLTRAREAEQALTMLGATAAEVPAVKDQLLADIHDGYWTTVQRMRERADAIAAKQEEAFEKLDNLLDEAVAVHKKWWPTADPRSAALEREQPPTPPKTSGYAK